MNSNNQGTRMNVISVDSEYLEISYHLETNSLLISLSVSVNV